MNDSNQIKTELSALAAYLAGRRDLILRSWLRAVELDPQLTTPSGISRAQFNDHIPQVLDAFERRLQAQDAEDKAQAHSDQKHSAAEHGLHRWQQGYNQGEAIREWGHLHYVLLNELEDYGRAHPQLQGDVMPVARRALVRLCGAGVAESAARYERQQRTEAAGRMRELELALNQLQSLDRQRAEVWREAAHDLRGTVGVISNASAILTREAQTDPSRTTISQILQRSVTSLRGLLSDLMDLARLEAGQEYRRLRRFDAAHMLHEFCDSIRPLAAERNLFLKAEGPASLPVVGDSVKILRIAQNLVLNALKVTERGGVCVQWAQRGEAGVQQWLLCVQDTGPGFQPQSPAAPLESALRQATAEAHELDASAGTGTEPAATLKSQSDPGALTVPAGEGIGLSIVKRLCELLDASLELETAPGAGTTFRVLLPRAYPDGEPDRD
ncbi:MAG TPA: sensor histidine kinase [Steroidobacteraceae bacterium]|nr:sensor histidine kinase [Steroidobacteraceae bacterium]